MNMISLFSGGLLLGAAVSAAPLVPASVSASHELPPVYTAARAIDGDANTRWAARSAPPQWLRLDFAAPVRCDSIRLVGVDAPRLYDTWRRLTVSFSDGSSFPLTLADHAGLHQITFPARTVSWIRFTIESTYRKTHYVGCSEVQVLAAGHGATTIQVDPRPEPAAPPETAARAAGDEGTGAQTEAWVPSEAEQAAIRRLARQTPSRDGHPDLWVNAAEIARARDRIRTRHWACRWLQDTLETADTWAAKTSEELRALAPPRHAVFDNKATCPVCGKALTASFERPHEAWCGSCRRGFPDAEYPDDGSGWLGAADGKPVYFRGLYNDMAIHRFDRALGDLADAYALTGEEPFARAASVLLDAMAVIYPTCDTGPKWYPGVGGRLNRPFYQAARTLIYYADQYDLTFASPEWDLPSADPEAGTRRDNVAMNLLGNGGEYCFSEIQRIMPKSLNNGFSDYLQGMVAAGRVLRRHDWVRYALNSELSIFHFIENTIDRDGQYFETAFMYSSHALDLFSHHAEMLRHYRGEDLAAAINLYEHPKLKLAFLRSERDIICAGHVPPLGDTGPTTRVIRGEQISAPNPYTVKRLEILAARLAAPAARQQALDLLRETVGDIETARTRAGGLTRWLVYHAAEVTDTAAAADGKTASSQRAVGNTLLTGPRGIGILRTGPREDTAALLRWGVTLNHGSPDEMNLNLFALGREITYDPGYLWAHLRAGWTKATGSHNLVVVNEKNQLGANGSGGSLELWSSGPGIAALAADNPACYGAEGVSRYRRALVLADLAPDCHYLLDVFRVTGGHTHDLNWHFQGELNATHGITLPAAQTSGSLAGPDIEWWKHLRADGWLDGVDEGFYWKAPPGNGYGFIFNLRRVADAADCSFDWLLGQVFPQPTCQFVPAEIVQGGSGSHHRLLASGVYFCRAEAVGDFLEFTLPVETADTYTILGTFAKSAQYGIVQATLDGTPLGEPLNLYSPSGYTPDPLALGTRHLEAGPHLLRLTVTGRDPESGGWFFGLRDLALELPERLRQAQEPVNEGIRLSLSLPARSELIAGQARSSGRYPQADYIVSRRRSDGQQPLETTFVSLVEPYVGTPQVSALRRLQVLPQDGQAAAEAAGLVAVCVESGSGRRDYIMEATADVPECRLQDNGVEIRFAGRFGVVRMIAGTIRTLGLSGPGIVAAGGRELRHDPGLIPGTVTRVDAAAAAIVIDSSVAGDDLAGSVVTLSNPGWSRSSAFRIKAATAVEGGTRLELDAASLVMARGLVGDAAVAPGTIANTVPLDHERMVHREFRTMYLQGRTLVAENGAAWGRVADVDTQSGHLRSTEPVQPRPGERFAVVEVAPGDAAHIMLSQWQTYE